MPPPSALVLARSLQLPRTAYRLFQSSHRGIPNWTGSNRCRYGELKINLVSATSIEHAQRRLPCKFCKCWSRDIINLHSLEINSTRIRFMFCKLGEHTLRSMANTHHRHRPGKLGMAEFLFEFVLIDCVFLLWCVVSVAQRVVGFRCLSPRGLVGFICRGSRVLMRLLGFLRLTKWRPLRADQTPRRRGRGL